MIMKFAKPNQIALIPIESRSKEELLELLETCKKSLREAELIATPVVCWDGAEGAEETEIIELLGVIIVPFEGFLLMCLFYSLH